MPRYFATAAISSSLSQPPFCSCAACRPCSTAERLRSGGNFPSQWSMCARVASLNATIGSTLRQASKLPVALIGPCSSSVNLTEHDVVGADHRDDVGQHVAAHDLIHGRQMGEAGRAQVHAERLVGAVGDQVAAELALRRLDRAVGLALGHAIALGAQLEVVDQ